MGRAPLAGVGSPSWAVAKQKLSCLLAGMLPGAFETLMGV